MRWNGAALGSLLAVILAGRLDAQAACPYEACALRMEGRTLLRGRSEVLGGGWFTALPRIAPLVARSDSAKAWAERYDRLAPRSQVLAVLAGLAGLATSVAVEHDAQDGVTTGLAGVTIGLVLGTWQVETRKARALARAIWWYNGSLPREGPAGAPPR